MEERRLMLAYVLVNLLVILSATIFLLFDRTNRDAGGNKSLIKTAFLGVTFLILFVISGYRGDFTSDYRNFSELFSYFNSFSWSELFNQNFYQEPAYVLLNRLIGSFTNNDLYLFLITTLIILTLFFREFRRDSIYIWISILLFINIGAYYTSFNITRQILAVSIIFAGSTYIYKREFRKYIVTILIASLFHQTSWLMIPFYFLLNLKFNLRNSILIITLSAVAILSLNTLIEIVQRFISRYSGYTYGMTGLNVTSVVVPVAILLFVIIHHKSISFDSVKHRVWLNASVYYTIFSIAGLKVEMFQRVAEFFNPYVLLIIPLIISEISNKNLRVVYTIYIIFFVIAYNLVILSGTGYDPYYFIWD